MVTAYLGLGTNRGDKPKNIETAITLLAERVGEVVAISSLCETAPWGFVSDNLFLNGVVVVSTTCTPTELLDATCAIEVDMGRVGKSKGAYQDRIIDIDILMYDNRIIQTEQLTIPHPFMHQRDFVMNPLAEVAPELCHPILHQTMAELAASLIH